MDKRIGQTGGEGRAWTFDPHEVENIGPIRDALVHNDSYFFEDEGETTLAKVIDQLLTQLPDELAQAVVLVHVAGRSYRDAGRTLGIDHKTVKSRVERGLKMMKEKLVDIAWTADLLRGYLPADEIDNISRPQGQPVVDMLKTLGGNLEQE